jgi:hypothetical protein
MKTEEALPEYGSTGIAMPRWKCHKEVHAFKIREIKMVGEPPTASTDQRAMLVSTDGGTVVVTADYMRKHRPQIGGYYVLYEDGYHSFSPASAFETGYALIAE